MIRGAQGGSRWWRWLRGGCCHWGPSLSSPPHCGEDCLRWQTPGSDSWHWAAAGSWTWDPAPGCGSGMNGAWGGGAGSGGEGVDGRYCGHWGSHWSSAGSGCRPSCQAEVGGCPGWARGRPTGSRPEGWRMRGWGWSLGGGMEGRSSTGLDRRRSRPGRSEPRTRSLKQNKPLTLVTRRGDSKVKPFNSPFHGPFEAEGWLTRICLVSLLKVLDWLRAREKCSSTTSPISPWK